MSNSATDQRQDEAKAAILSLFDSQNLKVAYDREIRYRLESQFPHDVTGKAIRQLERDGDIARTGLPGRRGSADLPIQFYKRSQSNYNDLIPVIRKKLELSAFIIGVANEMGRHAESAWWRAFKRNNWVLYPASEDIPLGIHQYQDRRASTDHDIDFIAEKDGIRYGVEVKNGLNYPDDLYWKFSVAVELGTIPLIIARWLNPGQVPEIRALGGSGPILYKDAMYSTTYNLMITDIRETLGAPIQARDEVADEYFARKIDPVHKATQTQLETKSSQLRDFILKKRLDPRTRRTLGDRR